MLTEKNIVLRLARAGRELAGQQQDERACGIRLIELVSELALASAAAVLGIKGVDNDPAIELPISEWKPLATGHTSGDVVLRAGAWTGIVLVGQSQPTGAWHALLLLRDVTDEPVACALASHASTALTLAFARVHAREREKQLFELVEAGKTLAREHHLEDVLQRIAELATSLVGARYGALGVLDESGEKLARFLTVGIDKETSDLIGDLPTGKGILGALICDPRPLRLRDLGADPRSAGFPKNHPPMKSFLGVPIASRKNVLGRLYLTEKQGADEFSPADKEIAIGLASQAGIAIENAELYEELELANAQLQVASEHKSSFLANMSHELRSPLNTIIGYATLLTEEPETLNDEQREDLRIIQDSGKHLLTLIADLLDLGKTEAGKLELHLAPMDAGELLADIVASLQPQVAAAVQLTASGLASLTIVADRSRLRQMLLNVLGNAVKFTVDGTVDVQLEQSGDITRFRVTDSGPGIPPADVSRIFDSFFQSEAALARTPRHREGAGLGLAITQALADRHGGTVALRSELGVGTVVTVEIPVSGPPDKASTGMGVDT
ncbi:MAG: GAF domain-containing sensor histidine kinase [Thermoleophilia bacterium]|nr:GAF domain-containing sensor histidine kinase [Thermoleophilia bacterium]